MRNLLSATVIGFTAITLFGRPGEFVRPYLIALKEKVPVTSQLAAWLLERIFDLLMALLLFGFRPRARPVVGPSRRSEADLGTGRRRQDRGGSSGPRFCSCCSSLTALRGARCAGACSALLRPPARRAVSAGLEKLINAPIVRAWSRRAAMPRLLLVLCLFGRGVAADRCSATGAWRNRLPESLILHL